MKIVPDQLPLPKAPYRGILPFRLLDWRIFMERDLEIERLANLVSMYRGVLLYGQSGSGKSSLLNAGLLPNVLGRGRAPERIRVFPKCGHELVIERIRLQEPGENAPGGDGLPAFLPSRFTTEDNDDRVELSCEEFLKRLRAPSELGVPLLLFDQFEELVTLFEENPKEKDQFKSAQAARAGIEAMLRELLLNDPLPVKIIFSFRDDYLARLTPLFACIPNLLDQRVSLIPPRMELVKQIVRGPFVKAEDGRRGLPGHFQNELSDELAEKIAAGLSASRASDVLNLSELQTLCLALWQRPERGKELLAAAKPERVLQKILESEANASLGILRSWERMPAIVLLSNLVTSAGTRDVVSEEKLLSQTSSTPLMWIFRCDLRKLLAALPEKTGLMRRSLSAGNIYYEITSEFLIPWIQKQQQAIRKLAVVIWVYICAALLMLLCITVTESYRAHKGAKDAIASLAREQEAKAAVESERLRAEEGERKAKAAEENAVTAKNAADAALEGEKQAKAAADADRQRAEEGEKKAKAAEENAIQAKNAADAALEGEKQAKAAAEENAKAAKEAGNKAIAAKKDAEDLIRYMQYDLRDKLQDLGHLDMMNSINARIRKYQQEHPAEAGDFAALREEGVALTQRGDVLETQGFLAEALLSYREALAIDEKLTNEDPTNALWQRDLSLTYNGVGNVLEEEGDFTNALKYYRDGLAIAQKLAKLDPASGDAQLDVSLGYERLGDVMQDQGDLTGALKSYRDSLAMREKLAKESPGDMVRQLDLSVSYNNIGDVLEAQSDPKGALKSFRDSLAIREKMALQDPGNAEWQRRLATCYERVGLALRVQGELTGSLKSYRDCLGIREKLAKQDPGNGLWQRDLSIGYNRVGDVLQAKGDFMEALKNYRDGLSISEKLAKQDPGNAEWQGDLAFACWRTGMVWANAESESIDQARAMVEKGRKVLSDLKQHIGLTALQQKWLDSIEAALKNMGSTHKPPAK